MLDEFDYKEPPCTLCGGKEFYDPDENAPSGRIPVSRIIEKLDTFLSRSDLDRATRLLTYWLSEARMLRDRQGELSLLDELLGLYRRTGQKEEGLSTVKRALALVEDLHQGDTAAGATILLNAATTMKAFGLAEEALPYYRLAEATYKSRLPAGDARFGGLYNNMALALCDCGLFAEAEAAFRLALSVMENVADGKPEMAVTYVNMAHMYEGLLRVLDVDACLREAKALLSHESIQQDGRLAFVLEKCAPSFIHFGYTAVGEEMGEKARALYARA